MTASKLVLNAASGAGGDVEASVLFVPVVNALVAIDCSDPSNLSELGRITNSTYLVNANNVVVDVPNNVAVVVSNDYLNTINISDPTNMSILDSYTISLEPLCMDQANSIVYGVNRPSKTLSSYDISNASSISQLDTLQNSTAFDTSTYNSMSLDLDNNVLYVPTGTGISSIDVSNASNMSFIDTILSLNSTVCRSVTLDVANDTAFVSSDARRIYAVNMSATGNMSIISSLTKSTEFRAPHDLVYDPNTDHVFMGGDNEDYLTSTDVSNTSSMTLTQGIVDATRMAGKTWLALDPVSQTLYATSSDNNNISSWDVSTASNMTLLDTFTFSTENYISGLALNIEGPASTRAYDSTYGS